MRVAILDDYQRVALSMADWPSIGAGVAVQPFHERLGSAKSEAALNAVDTLAGVVSALPTSVLVGLARSQVRTIDFAASNLRGSPVPLYLAGAQLQAHYPVSVVVDGVGLNITVMSYLDHLDFGIVADRELVDDVRSLLDGLRDELEALQRTSPEREVVTKH